MTVIDPTKSVPNQVDTRQRIDRSASPNGNFADVWRKTVSGTDRSDVPAGSPPSMASSVRPSRFSSDPPVSTDGMVSRAEQLLDTLDMYRQQLMDGRSTLRQIQPTIERMAVQSRSLSDDAARAEASGDLKSIVDQSLSLVAMEMARYSSGAYNEN
jgi:hypothetical protein